MVVNGSLSKTAVNGSAGADSQLSGLFVAVLTVVTLLFLTGLFEKLSEATLAAVVIAALIELVDIGALVELYRFHTRGDGRVLAVTARPDFVAAVAALLGVLVFDTLPGLFIGIAVSLLLLLYRASRPRVALLGRAGPDGRWGDVDRHPDGEVVPGVVVLRPEAGLFFANADAVRRTIRARAVAGTTAVVIDAETISVIDVTAVAMLRELAADFRRDGTELVLARDIGSVRDLLRLGPDGEAIRTYPTVRSAIAAIGAGEAAAPEG
jgi:sulfate permease, SulP family